MYPWNNWAFKQWTKQPLLLAKWIVNSLSPLFFSAWEVVRTWYLCTLCLGTCKYHIVYGRSSTFDSQVPVTLDCQNALIDTLMHSESTLLLTICRVRTYSHTYKINQYSCAYIPPPSSVVAGWFMPLHPSLTTTKGIKVKIINMQ